MRAERLDAAAYLQGLSIYVRYPAIALPPLIAAILGVGLYYLSGPLFAPVAGAGGSLISYLVSVLYGFAFGVSVLIADDAWRHGHPSLASAWRDAQQKGVNILLAVVGFLFLVYVAQLIGGIIAPIAGDALAAVAIWAFIYAIPAAAMGGVPGGATFSASLQAARRHPIATALLTIVSLIVWIGLNGYAVAYLGQYSVAAFITASIVMPAAALGYIAIVAAKLYTNLAFRGY